MLPLSRRIAVSANVVFSLYPTRNKVYLILSINHENIFDSVRAKMISPFPGGNELMAMSTLQVPVLWPKPGSSLSLQMSC